MCGRFTNRLTWREIVALYRLTSPASPERNLPARYNICPTTTIDAVIERDGRRELAPMRWGLVPSWWKKKAKETPATFNARAETVAEKPMFRAAFKRNRCLIPASGYYEWQTTSTGKQPYYFTAHDGSPLTVAGLWDEWKDIETGEPLKSCTMIIIEANKFVSKIHDRMPVILQPKEFDGWLTGKAGVELLKPAANDYLQTWPVSRRVNSSRAPSDDPTVLFFRNADVVHSWLTRFFGSYLTFLVMCARYRVLEKAR
jgi:putative SOS response-associated peptidase YedK